MKYTVKDIIELCKKQGITVTPDAVRHNIYRNLNITKQDARGLYQLTEKQKNIVMAHCKGEKGRMKKNKNN